MGSTPAGRNPSENAVFIGEKWITTSVAKKEGELYPQDMDISLKSLEEALLIRRQIGTLEKRKRDVSRNESKTLRRSKSTMGKPKP